MQNEKRLYQNKWVSRGATALLFAFFMFNYLNTRDTLSGKEYDKSAVYGTIDTIYNYRRGMPVVSIARVAITLSVQKDCADYLKQGDIINKEKNTQVLTTYRKTNQEIEIIKWGYLYPDDYAKRGIIAWRVQRIRGL